MRKEKEVMIGERAITVRELTARQIDQIMGGIDHSRQIHPAELLMGDHFPVEAVTASTGLTADDLSGDITPSELRELWDAVIEVNGFLSNLLIRLVGVGEKMSESTFAGPSAD